MDYTIFDRYVRRAAGRADRRSLLAVGSGALLAAGSAPFAVEAKKKGKKNRKSCKKRAQFCREFLNACEESDIDNPAACRNEINACCKRAATCKVKNRDKLLACAQAVICRRDPNEIGC